ncbi:MAG: hypothetical protein JSS20_10775 [Proteobacteria bacterium]|nr:hypothetical protein [Pseudomonadota bacterium]
MIEKRRKADPVQQLVAGGVTRLDARRRVAAAQLAVVRYFERGSTLSRYERFSAEMAALTGEALTYTNAWRAVARVHGPAPLEAPVATSDEAVDFIRARLQANHVPAIDILSNVENFRSLTLTLTQLDLDDAPAGPILVIALDRALLAAFDDEALDDLEALITIRTLHAH